MVILRSSFLHLIFCSLKILSYTSNPLDNKRSVPSRIKDSYFIRARGIKKRRVEPDSLQLNSGILIVDVFGNK